jgi:hypothetical protein
VLRQNPAYRPRGPSPFNMRTKRLLAIAVMSASFALLEGCQSSVPVQVFARPTPVTAQPAAAQRTAWAFRPSADRRVYQLEQRASITIRDDTLTRADTVTSHAELAFTTFAASGRVTGTITVFRAQSGAAAAATPPGVLLPFAFIGDYSARGRQLTLTTPNAATPCASAQLSVAQAMRDLWFQAPDTLRVGTTWADSASYALCRDGLPLQANVRRTFRITAASDLDGHATVTMLRTSRTSLSGTGKQSGDAVSLDGAGNGELTYLLDPAAGAILSARGTATFDFTLRSKLRTQRVRQTSDVRIERGA